MCTTLNIKIDKKVLQIEQDEQQAHNYKIENFEFSENTGLEVQVTSQ